MVPHSAPLVAHNLRGKLLLARGAMDDNVPPCNTYRVVDALPQGQPCRAAARAPDRACTPSTLVYGIDARNRVHEHGEQPPAWVFVLPRRGGVGKLVNRCHASLDRRLRPAPR